MECLFILKGHQGTVKAIAIIPSKNFVATSADSSLKIWSLATGKLLHTIKVHSSEITSLQYDEALECLISSSSDKTLKFTSINTLKVISTISGLKYSINCFHYFSNKAIVGTQNEMSLYDTKTTKLISQFKDHSEVVRSLDMDENFMVSASDDGKISVHHGNKHFFLNGHNGKIPCIQMDSNKLVSGSVDTTIKIWDVYQRKCIHTLKPDAGWIRCIQFDNNGIMISGHGDNSIRVWNFTSRK